METFYYGNHLAGQMFHLLYCSLLVDTGISLSKEIPVSFESEYYSRQLLIGEYLYIDIYTNHSIHRRSTHAVPSAIINKTTQ